MAVDVAVCFSRNCPDETSILHAARKATVRSKRIYLLLGDPTPETVGVGFFSLWADDHVDLHDVARQLSEAAAPFCISWKAEHGGVAGFVIYDERGKVKEDTLEGDEYLYLPSRGFAQAFGSAVKLPEEDLVLFPELLLDEEMRGYRIDCKTGEVRKLKKQQILSILEGDTTAEPVLPVEL